MHSALKKPPATCAGLALSTSSAHPEQRTFAPPVRYSFDFSDVLRVRRPYPVELRTPAARRTPRLICLILPSTEHPFPSHSHVLPPQHAHPPPHPQLPHVQGGKVQTGQHAVRGGELRQDPEEDQHRHAHQGGARLPGTAAGAGTATCLYLPGLHDLPVRAHGVGSLHMSMRRAFIPATSRPTPQGKLRHN